MNTIIELLLKKPQRIISYGINLCILGIFLLIAGLYGKFATTPIASILGMQTTIQSTKTLSETYPTLPTWWVPETFIGFFFSFILVFLGIILALTGKKLKQIYGCEF
jgi:uncharacterized membrane protein